MANVDEAANKALTSWLSDVGSSQDIVEVLVKMLNGWGRGTHDNVTVSPNWVWEEFEDEYKFLRSGCLLLSAGWPSVSLPDHADLNYPVPYGVFCDRFQDFLDKWFYPEQEAMRGVVDPLLARYRHDLETLSDDEWRERVKAFDSSSGLTAELLGVPRLEPWPRPWTSKDKGPRRFL